jgi:hypothetical protein
MYFGLPTKKHPIYETLGKIKLHGRSWKLLVHSKLE